MRTGRVVIGSNYGDEGKGLMTDYFAHRDADRCAVVRFNGGAQAGHTVVAPDGRRHVFSHFGSGTFAGCPTYLSRFFIASPMLYVKEHAMLEKIGLRPITFIHPAAFLTTPYDIFVNQMLERRRGSAKHGSCGVGINETVTRCLRSPVFKTNAGNMLDASLVDRLGRIGRHWLPERLRELAIDLGCEEVRNFIAKQDQINERFVCDVLSMLRTATVSASSPRELLLIFEGAQGLLLDENRIDQWPHLTRSKTGLTNVLFLAREYEIESLDVTYVTRTYLTRHGAGPLRNERDWSFSDQTNVPNQFQGTLRFAPLDCEQLNNSVMLDLAQAHRQFASITAGIAVTWADAMPIPQGFCLPVKYVAAGPTRTDVENVASRTSALAIR